MGKISTSTAKMLQSAYDTLDMAQIDYNYSARIIILGEAAGDQPSTKQNLDILLMDEQQKYTLNGVCAQFGSFALLYLEGKIDTLIKFIRFLQPYTQRWGGLPEAHPLCVSSRSVIKIMKKTIVLLFEEDVKPLINTFVHFSTTIPKCDAALQQTTIQQMNHTVAATLKLVSAVNLGLNEDPLLVLGLADELPSMHNAARLLGLPDPEQVVVVKAALGVNDGNLSVDQVGLQQKLEEKHDAYLKDEGTIYATECNEAIELDEFVYDLLMCNRIELIEEAGNLNEDWIYHNLKHILDK